MIIGTGTLLRVIIVIEFNYCEGKAETGIWIDASPKYLKFREYDSVAQINAQINACVNSDESD